MSETETEPTTEQDIPFEEPAPPADQAGQVEPEPDADETDAEAEQEAAADGNETDAEAEPQGLSEKEVEKINSRLDTLRANTAKRLGEILGEDAQFLVPCPLCNDPAPSMVWPAGSVQLDAEKIGAVSSYIGLPDLSAYADAPDAQMCPDCKGLGSVNTHSLVPNYTTKTCSRCVGKGYVGTGALVQPEVGATNGQEQVPVNAVTPTETELPPEAQALKDRGWMVIPPMQPSAPLTA